MTPDIKLNGASVADMGWLRETISFPVPQSQTNTIVIPGRNSPIRYTEALERVSYRPRSFSLTFSMLGTRAKYDNMVSEMANRYAGQLIEVSTSEEPELYTIGTLEISSEYDPLIGKGKLVISSEDADSYRYHTEITEVSQQIQGIRTITLMNDYMPVIPKVIITNGASLAWAIGEESFQKTLSPGTWELPELELTQGTNNIRVQTNGTITFQYKEGRL